LTIDAGGLTVTWWCIDKSAAQYSGDRTVTKMLAKTVTAGGLTIDAGTDHSGGASITGGAEILGVTDGHGCWPKPSLLVD
jgi:hypothetical protein